MERKFLPLLLTFSILISCGRKFYQNESGADRPVNKHVFSYAKRFTYFPSQIDTNAIYVHRCEFQTGGGMSLQYAYFRFFSSGQVMYNVFDSKLDTTQLNNLDKGIIGRYYFKNDKLRIQLFYNPGSFYTVSKFRCYFNNDTLVISNPLNTPSSWCTISNIYNVFEKQIFKFQKQKVTFKSTQTPNW